MKNIILLIIFLTVFIPSFAQKKSLETARIAGAFTLEQKLRMEDINNEFHLGKVFPTVSKGWSTNRKSGSPGNLSTPFFNSTIPMMTSTLCL